MTYLTKEGTITVIASRRFLSLDAIYGILKAQIKIEGWVIYYL
jgi:hypothetical protein